MSVRRWRFGDDPGPILEVLQAGGVVAIPTESSYGLAADPTNPRAVALVFEIKDRPAGKPLPVVTSSIANLPAGVRLRAGLETELAGLWPAPLTLVLDVDEPLPASSGAPTLAVRVPAHSELRRLLVATGPLTATSANRSGEAAAVDPEPVGEMLAAAGGPALLVDTGKLFGGPPSTLVRVEGNRLLVLRAGALDVTAIEAAVGASGIRSSTAFVENSADG